MERGAGGEASGELEPPSGRRTCFGFNGPEILFLTVITLVSAGVNFAIDIPASLEDAITKYYNVTQYQFSLLYTAYFLPSMFLNVLGGYLIDKMMGIRVSTLFYSGVAVAGISLFALGGNLKLFWLMIVGRLIFGLGNEMSGEVCMSYCTYTYFNKGSVNLLFSLTDNFSYLGTTAVFQLAPFLFQTFTEKHQPSQQALDTVLIICSCTYLVTAVLAVWVTFMRPSEGSDHSRDAVPITVETPAPIGTDTPASIGTDIPATSPLSLSNLVNFPPVFWLLCIAYCCFMNANFTFETFSQGVLTSSLFNLTVEESSDAVTIMNSVKVVLSVPLSMAVDRLGRGLIFVTLSMLLCLISYTLLCLTHLHPYYIMGLVGLSYSLTGCSIWTMFAYPVSPRLRGSCYGIVSAMGGLSQSLSPPLVGYLIDNYGYKNVLYFFLSNAGVAVGSIAITWILDCRSDGLLLMTPQQRSSRMQRLIRSESEEDLIRSEADGMTDSPG